MFVFCYYVCVHTHHTGKTIERKDRYEKVKYLFPEEVAAYIQRREFIDLEHVKGTIECFSIYAATNIQVTSIWSN